MFDISKACWVDAINIYCNVICENIQQEFMDELLILFEKVGVKMVTLEQLVNEQKFTEMSDIQIIKEFFSLNDMEEEGMDLVTELSKAKINKLKYKERIVEEWTSYLPSKYLYENYDLDTAGWLHTLELDYLSHGGELSDGRLKWAKENVPNIKMPKVYFRPLIEWLDDKGIRFKNEKQIEKKTFI